MAITTVVSSSALPSGTPVIVKPAKKSQASIWGHALQVLPFLDLVAMAAGAPVGAVTTSVAIVAGAIGTLLGFWSQTQNKKTIVQ
jgi:H+/Cl- antiporter ClcA